MNSSWTRHVLLSVRIAYSLQLWNWSDLNVEGWFYEDLTNAAVLISSQNTLYNLRAPFWNSVGCKNPWDGLTPLLLVATFFFVKQCLDSIFWKYLRCCSEFKLPSFVAQWWCGSSFAQLYKSGACIYFTNTLVAYFMWRNSNSRK